MTTTGNPLLKQVWVPRFDEIQAEHVEPAIRELLAKTNGALDEIENTVEPTYSSAVERLTDAFEPLEMAWGAVEHLSSVKDSPPLREAHDTVEPDVVRLQLRVKQSVALYRAIKELSESPAYGDLGSAERRVIEDRLRTAELAGVQLEGAARERFQEIESELAELQTKFSNNALDSLKQFSLIITNPEDVEGIPLTWRRLASLAAGRELGVEADPDKGPWRVSLEGPIFGPFMSHCPNRELREQVYREQVTQASSGELDNTPLIRRILELRSEKASLLGVPNFAELSVRSKMAGAVEPVRTLLTEVRDAGRPSALADLDELITFAREQTGDAALELRQWDTAFWAERLKEKRLDLTEEELRPYFPLPEVLLGMFAFATRMFGITVTPADGEAPVWDPSVRFFRVSDEDQREVAFFYFDPYVRPENKRSGAWMDICVNRRVMPDGKIRTPVAYINCNQTPPAGDVPSLMSLGEVVTLFHEFGHALQHMLTTVDVAEAAGLHTIEWDAIEIPSTFLGHWPYHPPTLRSIACHYQDRTELPQKYYEKIEAARTFRAGSGISTQVFYSLLDLDLHENFDAQKSDVFEVQHSLARDILPMPLLPEDRFLCKFGHIFGGGYAAGYFSYLWSAVLAADSYFAFRENGLEDPSALSATGRRFRDTFLAQGGSRHPMDVFQEFRGREPSTEPLLILLGLKKS